MTSALHETVRKHGRPPVRDSVESLWRGVVREIRADGMVWVEIPRLSGEITPAGPMPSAANGLSIGERVLVGAIEDLRGDLMVLCRETSEASAFPSYDGVLLASAPTAPNHATRKDYVDTQVQGARDWAAAIGEGKAPLVHTHAWVDVTGKPATFTPSAHTHVWADLTDKPATFTPSVHSHDAADVASGVFAAARLPAATSGAQGAMSAADKSKLDAATASNTANTIMLRNATGNVSVSNPTASTHAATRDYVDTQVATKANTVHGHTYADISGTVPTSALPPLAINDTFPVASQAAMLALTAQRGDIAIRSDNGRSYILSTDSPGTLADWKELMAAGQVQSVAGKTGVVALVKGDVGLGNVDNTTDAAKPVSTATQTALNGKAAAVHTHLWADVTDKPATFTPSAHTHPWGELTGVPATFAPSAHTHLWADLTDKPATFAPSAHEHSAADLTSGTVPVARLPLATTAAAGAMSSADKTALDALFADTGWVNVTYENSWTDYKTGVAGANNAVGAYRKIGGVVSIKGLIKGGSLGARIFGLPASMRPTEELWIPTTFTSGSTNGTTYIVIYPSGTVLLAGSGVPTYASIACTYMP